MWILCEVCTGRDTLAKGGVFMKRTPSTVDVHATVDSPHFPGVLYRLQNGPNAFDRPSFIGAMELRTYHRYTWEIQEPAPFLCQHGTQNRVFRVFP